MAFNSGKVVDFIKDIPFKFVKANNPDPAKAGNTLLVLNALGMLFAAASDTFAAAIDKNTPAEEKKFLIPAGVATGAAKIGLYYLITDRIIKGLKDSAKNIVDKMTDSELTKNTTEYVTKTITKAEKGFLNTGLFKKSDKYISSMRETLLKDGVVTDAAKKLYKDKSVAALGVLGAFIGAVVCSSILTPIIRDVSAYFVQKKMDKKREQTGQTYKPAIDVSRIGEPLHLTMRQPVSMKNFMVKTGSGLKI